MNRSEARKIGVDPCRLPPFGKKLILSTSDSIFIFLGDNKSWQRAANEYRRGTTRSLVLPDSDNPAAFRWPVQQRDIIVTDFGEMDELKYKRLSLVLLKQGALGVIVIHESSNTTFKYVKEGYGNA